MDAVVDSEFHAWRLLRFHHEIRQAFWRNHQLYCGHTAFSTGRHWPDHRAEKTALVQIARARDAETLCHIDFKFEDGSVQKRAFSYDWRLWILPEIREVLAEAGFRRSTVS